MVFNLILLKGKVVIVIGVGGGFGCDYVLCLVIYGVCVVVNDYGGLLSGEWGMSSWVEVVVEEIWVNGGEVIVDGYDIFV